MASQRILLVEGTDDEHVLKHICRKRDVPDLDEIRAHEGDTDLLDDLSTQLKASSDEGDTVGVVIDADKNQVGRWQSIRMRLAHAGYKEVPAEPEPGGTVVDPPDESLLPRTGVWIMPNNLDCGKLEHFLYHLVPQQDTLFAHATDTVRTLPQKRFHDKDETKAIMHTWLAWQRSPGRPYGVAIAADFLDARVQEVDVLVSWLNRLFYPQRRTP